jgi:NADH-quinone oxidoreductase subunit N
MKRGRLTFVHFYRETFMELAFYIAGAVAVISTGLMLTRLNVVHALLYLIVSLLGVAVVFYVLGAPFVAALEVIIYAGAIMVLFVFVVMMLNIGTHEVEIEEQWLTPGIWAGPVLLATILIIEVVYLVRSGTADLATSAVGPKQVGIALFGPYLIGVERAYQYFDNHSGQREELYLLLLLATLGCAVLVASSHFVSFVLGLEILSVSLYAMVAYLKDDTLALEAGIKYLILASASAAFLLFGMALIYAVSGSMEFSRIREVSANGTEFPLLLAGIVLTVTGIGFKLGVVPFHLWTPDVYQGAPAPVAAFVATTPKSAMVALLLRYFYLSGAVGYRPVYLVFSTIAIASMCAGNLLALQQKNVKRILAYSSIAHFGYILVAFLAAGTVAIEAVSFYLVAYTVTILAAFGIVSVLSGSERDADDLEDYRGLSWRRPVIASVFTAALFSLAGIPATMGFVGEFYVLDAGAAAAAWPLIIILVVTSVAGLFYYLRVVVALYSAQPEHVAGQVVSTRQEADGSGVFMLAVLAILLIWFGVYPTPLLHLIRITMASFN